MKDRWKYLSVAALCLTLLTGCAGRMGKERTVLIDGDRGFAANSGVFQGWGTSLCWWANRIGHDETLTGLAARAFCDPQEGLGLNILRYNIGGGDDPAHRHITRTDSAMEGFWAHPVRDAQGTWHWDWDWSRDARQRAVLEECLRIGGDGMLVEAFSNAPPYFLTVSGCSSGGEDPARNNLAEGAEEAFAGYLSGVAEHFDSAWGIRFQSLSPMNEPDTSYWQAMSPKQEGCHVDPGQSQSALLLAVRRALDEKGLNGMLLCGTDETDTDRQLRSLKRLTPEALAVLDRVDAHTYGGSGLSALSAAVQAAGKNLWMSETDGGDTLGKDAGEMGAGLWLARRIARDLNEMNPSAWILWQVIDSHISGQGVDGRRDSGMPDLNGGYWGTAVADHDEKTLYLTMKYYVFGQYTRYIRPGARLLRMEGDTVAALSPDGRTLAVVVLNPSAEEETVRYTVRNLPGTPDLSVPVRVIRTSGSMAEGEHWQDASPLTADGEGFTAQLMPFSVTTFLVLLR